MKFSISQNGRHIATKFFFLLIVYIIGTHSNNVLIWFTKRILGTVFLCSYNVCPK